MKYVIDIPKEVKEAFDKANDINFCFYDYNSVISKAIRNSTPLDNNEPVIKTVVHQYGENCSCITNCGTLNL